LRHVSVLAGGVLGALARWWLSAHLLPSARFPLATLVINGSGCFLLGLLLTYFLETEARPELRLGIATGFLGAYTTFSAWQEGVALLWQGGMPGLALVYLFGTLLSGLALAGAGTAVASRHAAGESTAQRDRLQATPSPPPAATAPGVMQPSPHAPTRSNRASDLLGSAGRRAAGQQ
jgi:CrcB protein